MRKAMVALAAWAVLSAGWARADDDAPPPAAGVTAHELLPGTVIELPSDWTFLLDTHVATAPASDIYITAQGMRILIHVHPAVGPVRPTAELVQTLAKADLALLAASAEKAFNPITFESATAHGVLASFTAADPEQGLPALSDERSFRVTNAIVVKEDAMITITVALREPSEAGVANQQTAIAAIQAIR